MGSRYEFQSLLQILESIPSSTVQIHKRLFGRRKMMRRYIILFLIGIAVAFTILFAIRSNQTPVDSNIVVQANNFTITREEFVTYKENLKIGHKLSHIPFNLKDKEIINRMIDRELLLHYAKNHHSVSKAEVQEYALQTEEAVKESESSEIRQLHEKLAVQLGIQPADYFMHPSVLKEYKNTLLMEKAVNQLYIDGVHIDEFVDKLRDEADIRIAETHTEEE